MSNFRKWIEYVEILTAVLVTALVLKLFVVDAVKVQSGSMESTVLPGDVILVNKLSYGLRASGFPFSRASFPLSIFPRLGTVSRGDVVVFRFPSDSDEPVIYVKRCVGLGGDTISIRDGVILVNGLAMRRGKQLLPPQYSREYTDGRLFPRSEKQNLDFYGPLRVPKRGDAIPLSVGNYSEWEQLIRAEGHSIARTTDEEIMIDGKPARMYAIEKNYLFVLGDNFYHSCDSRFWGFVPENNLIGEASLVYWSADPERHPGSVFDIRSIRWNRLGRFIR